MKTERETIPGSGLPPAALITLLGASIGLFLVWNGFLWKAPREASHVARFAVSYLAVVPLATLLLWVLRRFSWMHLVTSTGAVWAIKLVVTAGLYQALARGTATNLRAVAPPATPLASAVHPPDEYRAAASFASGAVSGRVLRGGGGLAGAVVLLEGPAPGRALPAAKRVDLTVSGSRYAAPLYLAHVDDELSLVNRDGVLHTAHISGAGSTPPNLPMPPSAEPRRLVLSEPGLYHVRCDNHPGEATWIVVVDHPYAVLTNADGSFRLEGVPLGEARLVVVAAAGATVRRAESPVAVHRDETAPIDVDVDAAPAISP